MAAFRAHWFLVGVLLLSSAPPARSTQAQDPCENPRTQAEMTSCAAAQLRQADGELNAVYQQLMKRLSAEHRPQLLQTQRAWLDFRNRHCELVAGIVSGGGTLEPLEHKDCLRELTVARSAQLEALRADANAND
jgi:uncharacterized protein YecT (DUF1311 family)